MHVYELVTYVLYYRCQRQKTYVTTSYMCILLVYTWMTIFNLLLMTTDVIPAEISLSHNHSVLQWHEMLSHSRTLREKAAGKRDAEENNSTQERGSDRRAELCSTRHQMLLGLPNRVKRGTYVAWKCRSEMNTRFQIRILRRLWQTGKYENLSQNRIWGLALEHLAADSGKWSVMKTHKQRSGSVSYGEFLDQMSNY
jgi:hypothetical protein